MLLVLTLSLAAAADTLVYPVLNHGKPRGEMRVVSDADSVVITYGHIDRNRGRWVQNRYTVDAAGRIVAAEARPMTRDGEVSAATERYRVHGDSVTVTRGTITRGMPRGTGYVALNNATAYDLAATVRHLMAAPGQEANLLPQNAAMRLVFAADTSVRTRRGPARVRLAMLHGQGATPRGVWVDGNGQLVASLAEWFITVHPDFVDALPTLRTIELAYRERLAAGITARLQPSAQGTVVIHNADVFDAERGVILPRHSIAIADGRITQVGPTAGFRAPRGAQRVDATGKTVIPGMWDMHSHVFSATQTDGAFRNLAIGVTTIRDMAADTDIATSLRDRANSGAIVAPQVVLAGIMEGPQLWAGPTNVLISTEEQARATVAMYDSLGYRQLKLYNLVHPDLVPTISEEAKRRGMRLSGHVPRGLSVPAAIRLGYDEINHAAFLFSTFHQDSLYWPVMRAYSAVAAVVAPRTDVDGPAMRALIADLKAHGTVVDGTFNLWLRDSTGADSLDAKAGNRAYLTLIRRLHDAGITLVPGTDGSSYNRELEHYEMAGIPAAQVLQLATLVSARVMGLDGESGSIAAGKVADLVIINGKPAEQIADLRRVEMVFRNGRGYTPAALLEAANTSTRP
jgi:imidazolonepropionase-like amidohydrolase